MAGVEPAGLQFWRLPRAHALTDIGAPGRIRTHKSPRSKRGALSILATGAWFLREGSNLSFSIQSRMSYH
jgi:hypothetical protein